MVEERKKPIVLYGEEDSHLRDSIAKALNDEMGYPTYSYSDMEEAYRDMNQREIKPDVAVIDTNVFVGNRFAVENVVGCTNEGIVRQYLDNIVEPLRKQFGNIPIVCTTAYLDFNFYMHKFGLEYPPDMSVDKRLLIGKTSLGLDGNKMDVLDIQGCFPEKYKPEDKPIIVLTKPFNHYLLEPIIYTLTKN